jgi:hypothetical protein
MARLPVVASVGTLVILPAGAPPAKRRNGGWVQILVHTSGGEMMPWATLRE